MDLMRRLAILHYTKRYGWELLVECQRELIKSWQNVFLPKRHLLKRLNRHLLEDAFRGEISVVGNLQLQQVRFDVFSYSDQTNRVSPPAPTLQEMLNTTK